MRSTKADSAGFLCTVVVCRPSTDSVGRGNKKARARHIPVLYWPLWPTSHAAKLTCSKCDSDLCMKDSYPNWGKSLAELDLRWKGSTPVNGHSCMLTKWRVCIRPGASNDLLNHQNHWVQYSLTPSSCLFHVTVSNLYCSLCKNPQKLYLFLFSAGSLFSLLHDHWNSLSISRFGFKQHKGTIKMQHIQKQSG